MSNLKPLQDQIEQNMKKAFWDIIMSDMNKDQPDYSHICKLILEIKERLQNLTPNNTTLKNELNEVLDEKFLEQLFIHKTLDSEHFVNLINFIMTKLKTYCSPSQDAEVQEFENELMAKFRTNIVYSEFIVFFIPRVHDIIDKIVYQIEEFKKAQKRSQT